jgi:hypothetical protein
VRNAAEAGAQPGASSWQALHRLYGDRIGNAVAREMPLASASSSALEAGAILGALDMAATARCAVSGVNFVSRHAISARGRSHQFRLACASIGVSADVIPEPVLEAADERFHRAFDAMADSDKRAVDLPEARQMMADAVRTCLREKSVSRPNSAR